MQLRRLAALERQKIVDELAEIELSDRRPPGHPGQPDRGSGQIVTDELTEAVDKYGDDRRTRLVPYDGDVSHRGPDRRRGRRRHHHPDRLRQAHQDRPVPGAAARRQGRAGRGAQAGRHRGALLRLLHPRLDPVLHEQGPGLPGQGLRAARGEPQRPRPARGQPAGLPAGREDRPGHPDPQLRGRAVPGAGHQGRPGQEERADRVRLEPVRRDRGDQPARRRRAGRRRAVLVRRRPAADLR